MTDIDYEPLFCISVRRKKELRRVKRTWGLFSFEYVPWSRMTRFERVSFTLLGIAIVCIALGGALIG